MPQKRFQQFPELGTKRSAHTYTWFPNPKGVLSVRPRAKGYAKCGLHMPCTGTTASTNGEEGLAPALT